MKKIVISKHNSIPSQIVKQAAVGRVNAITKRLGIEPVTELQENETSFFVELDITDEQVESLPIGLKKLFE